MSDKKKANSGEADAGSSEADAKKKQKKKEPWRPNCLNPVGKEEMHFMKECPKSSDEEKKNYLDKFHADKTAKAGKVGAMSMDVPGGAAELKGANGRWEI